MPHEILTFAATAKTPEFEVRSASDLTRPGHRGRRTMVYGLHRFVR